MKELNSSIVSQKLRSLLAGQATEINICYANMSSRQRHVIGQTSTQCIPSTAGFSLARTCVLLFSFFFHICIGGVRLLYSRINCGKSRKYASSWLLVRINTRNPNSSPNTPHFDRWRRVDDLHHSALTDGNFICTVGVFVCEVSSHPAERRPKKIRGNWARHLLDAHCHATILGSK